jgi:SnoaL-like protein
VPCPETTVGAQDVLPQAGQMGVGGCTSVPQPSQPWIRSFPSAPDVQNQSLNGVSSGSGRTANVYRVRTAWSEDRYARNVMDDVRVITNLVCSYAELLDTGDIDGLARLFTYATVRVHGGDQELEGADAVRQLIEDSVQLYDGVPGTKHLVTNLIVEVDNDGRSASARSYYTAFQARPELPLQPILAGRWHDRFERDGSGWRFTDRLIYTDLVGDVRFHLKGV